MTWIGTCCSLGAKGPLFVAQSVLTIDKTVSASDPSRKSTHYVTYYICVAPSFFSFLVCDYADYDIVLIYSNWTDLVFYYKNSKPDLLAKFDGFTTIIPAVPSYCINSYSARASSGLVLSHCYYHVSRNTFCDQESTQFKTSLPYTEFL
ncbi:hypothetical protein VNO77_03247 [Canavalia gladiata]|uniref:Uncharacterized protein n=1 Tax=Canavalia gladiata TaxID=3824 RepID=A0AAN9MUE8_CANGL